ncbi:hypothetical protein HID58_065391 [Brassica napus]|uniref:DUF1985 domain-containing protein n=1 Tax=Brassica napus TaxID=3708 RepID=A0ABQ7ZCR8_BRANA|nr:hypothetical protein HID58_065391 [Brassica napus]
MEIVLRHGKLALTRAISRKLRTATRRRRRDRATTVTTTRSSDTQDGHSHDDDEKRSSLSLVTTSLWKKHPRRVLTQGEDLWFTFLDQPMRFSLREFHLTTGLRCEEDQTITEPQFKIMKKPYL